MKIQEINFQKIKIDIAFDVEGSSAEIERVLQITADRDTCRRAVEKTSFLLMQHLKNRRRSQTVTFSSWWNAFYDRSDATRYLEAATTFGDGIRLYDSLYDVFNAAYRADYAVETEELAPLNTFSQLVEALRFTLKRYDRLSSASGQAHRSTPSLFEDNTNAENVGADGPSKSDSAEQVAERELMRMLEEIERELANDIGATADADIGATMPQFRFDDEVAECYMLPAIREEVFADVEGATPMLVETPLSRRHA